MFAQSHDTFTWNISVQIKDIPSKKLFGIKNCRIVKTIGFLPLQVFFWKTPIPFFAQSTKAKEKKQKTNAFFWKVKKNVLSLSMFLSTLRTRVYKPIISTTRKFEFIKVQLVLAEMKNKFRKAFFISMTFVYPPKVPRGERMMAWQACRFLFPQNSRNLQKFHSLTKSLFPQKVAQDNGMQFRQFCWLPFRQQIKTFSWNSNC